MPLALNAPNVKSTAKLAFAERILSNPRHLDSEGIIEHSIGFATDCTLASSTSIPFSGEVTGNVSLLQFFWTVGRYFV